MDLDSNAYLQALVDVHTASNTHLQALLEELRASKQQLGFGHSPRPRYIYANRQYPNCLWYFWDGVNNKPEPIQYQALTGIVEKLEIEQKEYKGKPDRKVNLHIRAERNYVIQSGLETLFAKGLLYTLSRLPMEKFKSAITIAVEPGDTEQVLFCRVYNPVTGQAAYAPYNEPVNWQHIIAWTISKIDTAHGRVEQEPQQKTA
jgi:hypothetical protein